MRTCALDFGRLVCAFHDGSYWPVGYKTSLNDSNDLGGHTTRPAMQVRRTCNTPAQPATSHQKWLGKQGHAGGINPLRIRETHDYRRFPNAGNSLAQPLGVKAEIAGPQQGGLCTWLAFAHRIFRHRNDGAWTQDGAKCKVKAETGAAEKITAAFAVLA